MTTLRNKVIRLAHEQPDLRPHLLPLVVSDKRASRLGHELLWSLLDRRGFAKLQQEMKKAGDEQSAKFLREVGSELMKRLNPGDDVERAVNRLSQCVSNAGRWDAALLRNNIFKVANELGLKLPSAMFASEENGTDFPIRTGRVGRARGPK